MDRAYPAAPAQRWQKDFLHHAVEGIRFFQVGSVIGARQDHQATRQHGAFEPKRDIVWSVDGGTRAFENAKDIIMSNFVVNGDGYVVDYHTGVIFVHGAK